MLLRRSITLPYHLEYVSADVDIKLPYLKQPTLKRGRIRGVPFRFIYLHRLRRNPPAIEQPKDISIRYVPLTQGKIAIVDASDFNFINQWKWRAVKSRNIWYAIRSQWNKNKMADDLVLMHRAILNPPDDLMVDHEDRDGLNNRKSNLRMATCLQNSYNRTIPKHNTSGYKGVMWDKDSSRWRAGIRVNGKRIYLGRFSRIEDAAYAYKAASKRYHGEFSRVK